MHNICIEARYGYYNFINVTSRQRRLGPESRGWGMGVILHACHNIDDADSSMQMNSFTIQLQASLASRFDHVRICNLAFGGCIHHWPRSNVDIGNRP
jgi:hypothetical protein